ncbi:DUF481 domain-containing protein [Altererythrobacter aerius]|uniref:DUF481 domain-containing protein n=1 Tax=Tsuneonella aeria TaxID=1837929 RepID=A0A6I4TA85_9SPHN|nr:DUF481 domain-containing protein [Tsuneonella aeria]MXO74023.1 DUF481 domain-containing protein [Tsuneonella aeria]
MLKTTIFLAFSGLAWTMSANAALPAPVRDMIRAAIATGDAAKVATVAEIARAAYPGDVAEVDALERDFHAQHAAAAAAEDAALAEARRNAGVFDLWKGRGELSGFRSTGNSDNAGIGGSVTLTRTGPAWSHKLTGRADVQRSRGQTTRDQLTALYEPRIEIREGLFAYGLAQYERDRFQGFAGRYAVSGGVGYRLVHGPKMDLSIKTGPAYRVTHFVDGGRDSRLAGLFGLDFDWRIAEGLIFTQDANAVAAAGGAAVALVDSRSTTVNLVSGLEAKVTRRLSTRVSYSVDYDSEPAIGRATTDTMTRFGFVYGF